MLREAQNAHRIGASHHLAGHRRNSRRAARRLQRDHRQLQQGRHGRGDDPRGAPELHRREPAHQLHRAPSEQLAARYRGAMAQRLLTERLVLRPWTIDDAEAARGAYGDAEVARWLIPAMDRVLDAAAMRLVLQQWVAEDARLQAPAGRWGIELRDGGRLIGGATLLPLPPD